MVGPTTQGHGGRLLLCCTGINRVVTRRTAFSYLSVAPQVKEAPLPFNAVRRAYSGSARGRTSHHGGNRRERDLSCITPRPSHRGVRAVAETSTAEGVHPP